MPLAMDSVKQTVHKDVDCMLFARRAARSLVCTDDVVVVEEKDARATVKVHATLESALEQAVSSFAAEHVSRLEQVDFDVKPVKVFSVRDQDGDAKFFALQAAVVAYQDISQCATAAFDARAIYYKTFGLAARILKKPST